MEVVRGRGGTDGTGRVIPWEALYPQRAPVFRYADAPKPEPALTLPVEHRRRLLALPTPPAREESTRHRVMPCSVHGMRPGRDAPLPSLRARWACRG